MNREEFPLWLEIETIIFVVLIVLFSGLAFASDNLDPDTGVLGLISLSAIGILVAIWVLSYALNKKSWRFFLYGEGLLLLAWLITWLITDNF